MKSATKWPYLGKGKATSISSAPSQLHNNNYAMFSQRTHKNEWNLGRKSAHYDSRMAKRTHMIRDKNLYRPCFGEEPHLQQSHIHQTLHKQSINHLFSLLIFLKTNFTLFTIVTTASRISPLNGRNTTHWYFTGKVTKPVPSRIRPFPTLSMPVIATMNPCRPLKMIETLGYCFQNSTKYYR